MNITLHSATEQVRALLDQIDPETGELPEGFESARAIVQQRAVAVTAYIHESERQVASLKEYAKELAERAKRAERGIEWLKGYLLAHMQASGMQSITDERGIFSAKVRQNPPSVVIDEPGLLPEGYWRQKPPPAPEPDKTAIAAALKEGRDVPGAHLERGVRLEIK